jgi:hypothetical protein
MALYTEWGIAPMSLVAIAVLICLSSFAKPTRMVSAIRVLCMLQLASFAALSAYANFAAWPPPSEPFLGERRLAPLDGRPCCIMSGTPLKRGSSPGAPVQPIAWPRSARTVDDALAIVRETILGGHLRRPHRIARLVAERRLDDGHAYAHYTFRIGLFRFVDDVELLLDAKARQVHFRSHLRVGQGDMGANADRMDALRRALAAR